MTPRHFTVTIVTVLLCKFILQIAFLRVFADRIENEAQVAADHGNTKGMFNAIRRLTNNMRPAVVPIRDKEGKPITSIEGQIHRWKEYLEEILNTSTTNMKERN